MLQESILDKVLYKVKKLIPKSVFNFFEPLYHWALAYIGAMIYGFPSNKLKVIGVTGTKGKSTVVYLITKLLIGSGRPVGACGSLGFVIAGEAGASSGKAASRARSEGGERSRSPLRVEEWPNTLKMTMPGRFRLHKLMAEAVKAGCEYFVLEVTSEGIKQKRHIGINFDCAVFTNIHREHLESHGSFENYYQAKQELFRRTKNIHVINADDPNTELFGNFPTKHKIFFGLTKGDLVADKIKFLPEGTSFELYGTIFNTYLTGKFNVMNCLAALSVGVMYGMDLPSAKPIMESVKLIPGRMEFIQRTPFTVVVDYAHTPDSLEQVYKTLKTPRSENLSASKLICVLGAAGGGRDKWKRPEFGSIAEKYCDQIILTDEDPYDEKPETILEEIVSGFSKNQSGPKHQIILDRKEAIKKALLSAKPDDTVVITGKGSEISMAVAGNRKIPWSDRKIVGELLSGK